MNILDFERRKRRISGVTGKRKMGLRGILLTAGGVIAVASAAIWLIQDVKNVADRFGLGEGSLIVNINTASEEQLITVPGIGPTRAAQIVVGRPYESIDDLEEIAGIGGKTLESLRPFVTVEGKTRKRE